MTTQEPIDGPVELNIFVKTPEGYDAHIKVTHLHYRASIRVLAELSLGLDAKGFTHSAKNGAAAPAKPVAKKQVKNTTKVRQPAPLPDEEIVCFYCDGPTWNNTQNKRNPRGPDYRCKDKECGATAWFDDDGELNWKEDQ